MSLRLDVRNVAGPAEWEWVLAGEAGELADHRVRLDRNAWQYLAFTDLHRYLRWNAAPDRRAASEAELLARVGAWASTEVLGERIARLIADVGTTVRVTVPADAEFLLYQPLDLAHVDGRPLAARDGTGFVFEVPDAPTRGKQPADSALRMLAVFSLPHSTAALSQHRERHRLTRLVREIATRHRRKVELTVVQYGVTRDRLAALADDGAGWDVVHLSGHGGAGVFALEEKDGSRDVVGSDELVRLLRPTRHRVKLAVVSACESAAATTAQARRVLGAPEPAGTAAQEDSGAPATGLALALVRGLACPVVAMRYPVADVFATAFAEQFYGRLFGPHVSLETAVREAIAAAHLPNLPLSATTPAVFANAGPTVSLEAPPGEPVADPAAERMAHFPAEPERFVGRAELMAKAGAALTPRSGRSALLLHGMAGAGKTAAALELVYRRQDSFDALVFWRAPTRDDEAGAALADLSIRMETQVPGLTMVDRITTAETLERFLPDLTRLLDERRLLLVLDNLETLLTPAGRWRDDRWGPLIGALTRHRGDSKVVLTSRVPPPGLDNATVETLAVSALSQDETLLLARELPHLARLLHLDTPAATTAVAADRYLVRRTLALVRGHPKLLELADATAADRRALVTRLNAAEAHAAARGTALPGFFHDVGTGPPVEADFVETLGHWTRSTLDALPESVRVLAQFLACLEEEDRQPAIVADTWPNLWRRLGRQNAPADPDQLLDVLRAAALVQRDGDRFRVHPGVAEAVRDAAGADVRTAVDTELAAFCNAVFRHAARKEGAEDSRLMVRAGLAALPYMLRLHHYRPAVELLEHVVIRDRSPATVQATVSALRRILSVTEDRIARKVLADALRTVDPGEAERLLRQELAHAVAEEDHNAAGTVTASLFNLLRDARRLDEALQFADQAVDLADRAGHGPWTQLLVRGGRLQILSLMGDHRRVLADLEDLRAGMDALSDRSGPDDPAESWVTREGILDTGCESALALRDWEIALGFTAEVVASRRRRGAPEREVARARFKSFAPLVELDRADEADRVLRDCQRTFEDRGDIDMLVPVFAARALLETAVHGRPDAGLDLQRTALRLGYARADVRNVAVGHHNFADFLGRVGADPAERRAHVLAAALLYRLTGMGFELGGTLRTLNVNRGAEGGEESTTFADIVEIVERTDGVRLGDLVAAFGYDAEAIAAGLAEIFQLADELAK